MLPPIRKLSVTQRLLVKLTGAETTVVDTDCLDLQNIDWQLMLELLDFHRVTALAAPRLLSLDTKEIPSDVKEAIRKKVQKQTLHSLATTRATIEIATAFAANGINAILMKGDAVSRRYYGSPAARFSRDIDFLTAAEDFQKASRVLTTIGYEQVDFPSTTSDSARDAMQSFWSDAAFRNRDDGTLLELHWRFCRNPKLLEIDFPTAHRNSDKLLINNTEIRVFGLPLQLVYLTCHGASHAWFRLKWIADVNRIMGIISDEELVQARVLAKAHGVTKLFDAALDLHNHLFEHQQMEPVPKPVADERNRYLQALSARQVQHTRSFAQLGELLRQLCATLGLHQSLSYKMWACFIMVADYRDLSTLGLSSRWWAVYLMSGSIRKIGRALKK